MKNFLKLKQTSLKPLKNPGEQGLNKIFKPQENLLEPNVKKGLMRFSGLKRYLKRTI